MTSIPTCAEIRPLLFDYKDGALPIAKRNLIHAHLAICKECLAEERAEDALSCLLRSSGMSSPSRRNSLVARAVIAIAAGVLIVLTVMFSTARERHGSITHYDADSGDRAGARVVSDLGISNHFELSAGEYKAIHLDAVATISVPGPAVLDLSRVEDRWTAVLLRGKFFAQVETEARFEVSTTQGRRILDVGSYQVSADSAPSPIPVEPSTDVAPVTRLQQGLRAFHELQDMPRAEKLMREVIDHANTTPDLKSRAQFYLAGALGRQNRHADAFEAGKVFLADNPNDPLRDYVTFFQGVYQLRLGQRRSAHETWKLLLAENPEPSIAEATRNCLSKIARSQPTTAQDVPPATLLERGIAAFFEQEDMKKAETLFRRVLDHEKATAHERSRAGFYLSASLGRQNRHADALAEGARWIAANPKDPSRNYAVFFQGIYHRRLGQEAKAREIWKKLLKEHPKDPIADSARACLQMAGPGKPVEKKPSRLLGKLAAKSQTEGGYLVYRVDLKPDVKRDAEFAHVAANITKFHKATIRDFDGTSFDRLAEDLKRSTPRRVLFVLKPETLDINFHRRILLMSSGLDEDVFPDFTFGYMTAADAEQLRAFWERTRKAQEVQSGNRRWISTAVSRTSMINSGIPGIARAAGYTGKQIYWATIESDANAMTFVDRHLKRLEKADVISMTGNGDPQGIWLFSDQRNIDRSKHWIYEPAKVGQHKDEMPRIMASRFAALNLDSPVIWSGTCHCAATNRVFVEGDIISTFGRTDVATVHVLEPANSICLSLIKAGALAFLAPIAANHGMSVSMEQDFAWTHGADLGETVKSTYDDVFLAAEGNLVLDLPEAGKPHQRREAVMQGGGSNRILIGDPALSPFEKIEHPLERVTITNRRKDGFDVVVIWDEGWHPRAWDIFGSDRNRDWRVKARIPLDDLVPDRDLAFAAKVRATDDQGQPFPYTLRHCEPEEFHGKRYLHLQANAPRKTVSRKGVRVVFSVTYR